MELSFNLEALDKTLADLYLFLSLLPFFLYMGTTLAGVIITEDIPLTTQMLKFWQRKSEKL